MPSQLVFGSDSEEEMDMKSEYIEELVKLQKYNGVLELSQPDLPRFEYTGDGVYKPPPFLPLRP